jgi:hypothetical protein
MLRRFIVFSDLVDERATTRAERATAQVAAVDGNRDLKKRRSLRLKSGLPAASVLPISQSENFGTLSL